MKKIITALVVVVLAAAAFIVYFAAREPEQVACTMEAKICPDGTAVGRTGPKCEFAPCPSATSTPDDGMLWKTVTDPEQKITYQYPDHLLTTFIKTQTWPPQVTVEVGDYSCEEIPRAGGLTKERTVGTQVYCLHILTEGAAGSMYLDHLYTTEKNGKLLSITFTLRQPQCDNYDDPQKTQCKNERETFDIDGVVDRIAQSVRYD